MTIHRADYRPPAYAIDAVELSIDLDPKSTLVRSRLAVRRANGVSPAEPLQLDGEALELVSLRLNGEEDACLPARLEITGPCTARLELIEGRFHQVKRMFLSQGLEVLSLHRSRFGDFDLTGLAPGEWRLLPMPTAG